MLSLRATRTVRWLHLWLGVIVGVQIILWTASGLVMVARPLEEVRGTTLRQAPAPLVLPAGLPAMIGNRTDIEKLELATVLGRPAWRVTGAGGRDLIDAATGRPRRLGAADAEAIARAGTRLTGAVTVTRTAADAPPLDWRRPEAAWAVSFADGTRVYVSDLGEIGAIRTPWWRFYDLFWGLHIMDWRDREDTHHPLIITATLLALGTVLTGAVLTVHHFVRRR